MKGQHVNSLDVAEFGCEPRYLSDLFGVVCQSGNQHEAHPDRPSTLGQAAREIEGRGNVHPCKTSVALGIPALDIEQHQVNFLKLFVGEAAAQAAVGV